MPYLEWFRTHPFMIKMCNLLAEDEILEERGASFPSLQAELVLDRAANVRGQIPVTIVNDIALEMSAG